MSGQPVSLDTSHPPHGHPDNTSASAPAEDKPSTASHPHSTKPDPTTSPSSSHAAPRHLFHAPGESKQDASQARLAPAAAASASELARLKVDLKSALRQFPDFPTPGVLFEDIMPIFKSHALFTSLIRALELQVAQAFGTATGEHSGVDIVVGLESRGFLFGPTLALKLGAGFVPVRKQGKLPGPCETEGFKKEYGEDFFQMQSDAIPKGAKVVIVDDIIATGGSAQAAGSLVRKLGGELLGYIFIMELDFLKGRDKLDAPVHTLLSGQEEALKS